MKKLFERAKERQQEVAAGFLLLVLLGLVVQAIWAEQPTAEESFIKQVREGAVLSDYDSDPELLHRGSVICNGIHQEQNVIYHPVRSHVAQPISDSDDYRITLIEAATEHLCPEYHEMYQEKVQRMANR